MSERGSFVTEYIYCQKCFEAAKNVLLDTDKYLCSIVLPCSIDDSTYPIIAGKIGSLGAGQELVDFEFELMPKLEKTICHSMRVAVLADDGERIFFIKPDGYEDEN